MNYEDTDTLEGRVSDEEFDMSSYFSNDNETSEDSSSIFVSKKKRKQNNTNENGSYIFTRMIDDVRLKIPCFATKSTMGTKIKSATLGTYYDNMYVGKNDENMLFKVRVINGETGKSVFGNDLYYDSPEEYERHLFVKVSPSIKENWMKKYRLAKSKRNTEKVKNEEESQKVTIVK
jgi:hypothetical protein